MIETMFVRLGRPGTRRSFTRKLFGFLTTEANAVVPYPPKGHTGHPAIPGGSRPSVPWAAASRTHVTVLRRLFAPPRIDRSSSRPCLRRGGHAVSRSTRALLVVLS
jgi:hypothetical protein